ncbi:MAG: UbiX family flavin prenyltransferase [Eggerthellaceae bacterium]|nr:UbiX family flavin prenyltransferase [Eggerthellaceae bacterium]
MKKIIVGITGASGALMGYRLLEELHRHPDVETHLIVSSAARKNFELETDLAMDDVFALADVVYNEFDMAAAISSGSFRVDGMVVIPCSMKTLAGISAGFDVNLIIRAAGICLKERRKLVLVPRETPLSEIHLRNMVTVTEAGAVLLPPMLTFYNGSETLEQQVTHIVGKVLMQFDLDTEGFVPWG